MKFRNSSGAGLSLGRPEGKLGSLWVGPGEDVEVPGTLAKVQPPDGYAVEHDDQVRVWPGELWELLGRDARTWKRLREQADQDDAADGGDIGGGQSAEEQGETTTAGTAPVDEHGEG